MRLSTTLEPGAGKGGENSVTEIHSFNGKVLAEGRLELGEGPIYDFLTERAWWFDILGKTLWEYDPANGAIRPYPLPFMASVLALVDGKRQLLASDEGLFLRDVSTSALTPHLKLEPNRPGNRSNDGRVHPSGALWIGTMGKGAETGVGAIYHVAGATVTTLFDNISIPNAICFSPDGATGYFADSRVNMLMRVPLDPATGLPLGPASVLVDGRAEPGVFDGSVCDAEGTIWNVRWNAGAVDRYAPDGTRIARYELPAKRTTCPAFIGEKADRMIVTSAYEGLDEAARAVDSLAGATFELGITVQGRHEPVFRL
ncbi:MAG: SMP-30/gluconolactonase/LRE family protein [Rhizobium sp.]